VELVVASPLHAQILNAINSIRPYLYGAGFSILLLKQNGIDKQYDPLSDLTEDFIVSFDRSGNLTLMLASDQFDFDMRDATHLVFDSWIYHLTEPAKPPQGPFPMWKVTGRPIGSRYIPPPEPEP
jgi:hypothetical protein